MIVLDTGALVRFFTKDIPTKAEEVKKVIEEEVTSIPDVVFPELEYFLLGNTYQASRIEIAKAFQYLISKKNIKTSKEIKSAVLIYKKTKLDIADCIIIACSKSKELLSFDEKMVKVQKKLHNVIIN